MNRNVSIVRSLANPLLTPADIPPSTPECNVEGVLNPGAFEYNGRIGLVLRVAERPREKPGTFSTFVWDDAASAIRPLVIRRDDPKFRQVDPRGCFYGDKVFLSTMSHLMVVWSDDGEHFSMEGAIRLFPSCPQEGYGIEDCRVGFVDGTYVLTYSAAGEAGVGVALRTTRDWKTFSPPEFILPPLNKDCCVFKDKGTPYFMLHRPSAGEIGGNSIWFAQSSDLAFWGRHRPVIMPRSGSWDCERVGAGSAPILTDRGWLEIYHGANEKGRYSFGILLLDKNEPWKVLYRSTEPIMTPEMDYEKHGFCNEAIFTNGLVVKGDEILLYYGAADSVTALARLSLRNLLDSCMTV